MRGHTSSPHTRPRTNHPPTLQAPVYVEMVTEISNDVKAIESKMSELRIAHEARVRCVRVGFEVVLAWGLGLLMGADATA